MRREKHVTKCRCILSLIYCHFEEGRKKKNRTFFSVYKIFKLLEIFKSRFFDISFSLLQVLKGTSVSRSFVSLQFLLSLQTLSDDLFIYFPESLPF